MRKDLGSGVEDDVEMKEFRQIVLGVRGGRCKELHIR
jgi:hypothetical protein